MSNNSKTEKKAETKPASVAPATPAAPAAHPSAVQNALVTAPASPVGVATTLKGFKVAKVLTVPFVLITPGVEMVLEIKSAMVEQKEAKFNLPKRDKAAAGLGSQDPWVCDVVNVQTGAMGRLICNAIIQSSLKTYENDSYVGRVFAIRNNGRRENKNYMDMQLVELERDDSAE